MPEQTEPTAVRDRVGDLWVLNGDRWSLPGDQLSGRTFEALEAQHGPLTVANLFECQKTSDCFCPRLAPKVGCYAPESDPGQGDDHQMQTVRCYSCGHQYAAVPDRLDTACPECGSDSYVRVNQPERCREDYVYVGQDVGGSVYRFCDTCPRRVSTPPERTAP